MERNIIDYYQTAPFVIVKKGEKSIKFEKKNGQTLVFNNEEKRLTLEILCKKDRVEINDITSEGKPVDIDLLNDLVNKGYLVPCLDFLP